MKVIVHVDGGARGNPGPAAAACVIALARRRGAGRAPELLGRATNNVAEYRALLLGLRRARELGASEVEVVGDSELIAKQVQGLYKVKHEAMRRCTARPWPRCAGSSAGRSGPCRARRTRDADALVNAALDGDSASASRLLSALSQCSGCAELAIASICAFESSSSSVLVSQ